MGCAEKEHLISPLGPKQTSWPLPKNGVAKLHGDEVSFLQENELLRSYRVTNQHSNLP